MRHITYAVLLCTLMGCTTVTSSIKDVSADLRVQHHIGREFVLRDDLYLYLRKTIKLKCPLIGPSKAGPLGLGQPRLPAPVSSARIGYEDPQIRVVGVLKKGTVVRISRVMHLSAPTDQHFYIELDTSDPLHPHAEYHIHAIGGLEGAVRKDFSQKPWFFDYYGEEVTAKK